MYLLLSQHRAASSLIGYLKAGTGGVLVVIKVKSVLRVRMRRFCYLAENSLPLIKLFCMWELCTVLWSIHIPFRLDWRRLESVDGRTWVIDILKHHTTHSSASQPSTSRPREKEKKNSIWKQHKLCWILHFMQLWAAQLWINCLESPAVALAVAGFFSVQSNRSFVLTYTVLLLLHVAIEISNSSHAKPKQASTEAGGGWGLVVGSSEATLVFYEQLQHSFFFSLLFGISARLKPKRVVWQ